MANIWVILCFFLVFIAPPGNAEILYEYQGTRADLDTAFSEFKTYKGEVLAQTPIFDSAWAFNIDISTFTLEDHFRYFKYLKKTFPLLKRNCFRFHFAFDGLTVLDTLPRAAARRPDTVDYIIFRLINDEMQEKPLIEALIDYHLVLLDNRWHLKYTIKEPNSGAPWKSKIACEVRPHAPYFLEYLVVLNADSLAQSIELRVNGNTQWLVDLEQLKFKLKTQIVFLGCYAPEYAGKGHIFLNRLAFGNDWLGAPPRRPGLTAALERKSTAFPPSVALFSPAFKSDYADDPHFATRYQVHVAGQDPGLPLYDSGPDSVNLDSILVPLVLDPKKQYLWRVSHISRSGNQSEWSRPAALAFKNDSAIRMLEKLPKILEAGFTLPGQKKLLKKVRADTWYNFKAKLWLPGPGEDVAYAIFWCSNSAYTLGNESNRGGRFYPKNSYVYNFSFSPYKAFEKSAAGSYKSTRLEDSAGLYVDGSAGAFRWSPQDSTIYCRVKFLPEAGVGKWSLRGFVRNNAELSSPMFYSAFEIAPSPRPAKPLPFKTLFAALAGLVILVVYMVRRRLARGAPVPARDREIFGRFKEIMEKNLGQEIGRAEIEKLMALPYSAVLRSVKAVTKNTPVNYLLQMRLERIKVRLKETDKSVKEIMMETGFLDPAHFSKIFKKYTGKSPSEFREKS
jgi:AraC-like DNA-binding protein